MGQQFCTACGARLTEGMSFCEHCGARIEETTKVSPSSGLTSLPENSGSPQKFPVGVIAGIIIVLILLAAAAFFILPLLHNGSLPAIPGTATPVPTTVPTPKPTPSPVETTIIPSPTPDPFPNALSIGELFNYNEGKTASRATVYRVWMNETYHWHNDMDNRYWTEPPRPDPAHKYVLVFVNIENIGTDGYPYPKSNMIVLHNNGNIYRVDTSHYLPDKAGNIRATAIEIEEIEYLHDYFNAEHVEDYGYSHATTQDFVFPGQGNAIDGYLIYKVPKELALDTTYVEIVFDGQDRAVWKLG